MVSNWFSLSTLLIHLRIDQKDCFDYFISNSSQISVNFEMNSFFWLWFIKICLFNSETLLILLFAQMWYNVKSWIYRVLTSTASHEMLMRNIIFQQSCGLLIVCSWQLQRKKSEIILKFSLQFLNHEYMKKDDKSEIILKYHMQIKNKTQLNLHYIFWN